MNNKTIFVEFIRERERVRIKKEKGLPRPWTNDSIIDTYRFCNVDRQNDRETKGLQKWLKEVDMSDQNMVFNAAAMRIFNKTSTMMQIGHLDAFSSVWRHDVIQGVNKTRKTGSTVFNAAYIVSTNGHRMDKVEYVMREVLQPLAQALGKIVSIPKSCEEMSNFLRMHNGFGAFIANQIVTDLKYTRILRNAKDWKSFVAAGPGTRRGLRRFYGVDPGSDDNAALSVRSLRGWLREQQLSPIDLSAFDDLNNVSNCLCEYDKYMRALLDEGRPKQKYRECV